MTVVDRLQEIARQIPDAIAIAEPTRRVRDGQRVYRTVTFAELSADVFRIARGLVECNVRPGLRMALLVPPSIDFITLVFALLESGAVQILIDPGMGRKNLLRCLDEAEPLGFVAIPMVQAVRSLLRKRYRNATLNVTVGNSRWWWGGLTLDEVRQRADAFQPPASPGDSVTHTPYAHTLAHHDPAAIIFTTGSTGPPKGVLYRHGNFDRQVTEIRNFYNIQPGEIDLPCFPLFGLFNAAMGVTTIIPRMNASRPARVDPANIVEAIQQWQVTQSFASPAVWNRVGPYCQQHSIALPSLRRVLSAGAPVPARVLAAMKSVIAPDGEVHTPYGATEALPVASIGANEVLSETWRQTEQGRGVCVGRRFPGIEWRVIRIVDEPIERIEQTESLSPFEIGELIVRGAVVTSEYATRQEANALAKIRGQGSEIRGQEAEGRGQGSGVGDQKERDEQRGVSSEQRGAFDVHLSSPKPQVSSLKPPAPSLQPPASSLQPLPDPRSPTPDPSAFFHRMGDCGYLDEQGRFWFCGRVAHRVLTAMGPMYTIACEAIFNLHPRVFRCALVGVSAARTGIGDRGSGSDEREARDEDRRSGIEDRRSESGDRSTDGCLAARPPARPDWRALSLQRPVIVVEPHAGQMPRGTAAQAAFIEELRTLAGANPLTSTIHDFLFLGALPVDIRHNAKIFREQLAVWAERQ